MSVSVGKSYHIKDSFFSLVNDSKLMVNKEGNNYRPHFFFFEDTKTNGLGVNIHSTLSASIISNAKEVLSLHDRGYKLVFPNINNIYALMKNELYPDETSDAAKNWSNISSFTGDLALNQVLFFYLNTKKSILRIEGFMN